MKFFVNAAFYLPYWCAVLFFSSLLISSCSSDQLPEPIMAVCELDPPTYEMDIKAIIDESCAYSGCHLDSSPGRFDTYNGLLPYLQNNTFRQRVLIQRGDPTTGMPPDYAVDSRPTNLTQTELTTIECWLEAGFPE